MLWPSKEEHNSKNVCTFNQLMNVPALIKIMKKKKKQQKSKIL